MRKFSGGSVKRPAFQFYPKDWRNNAKLRRCSPAARGAWMDILCLLHDSEEDSGQYGVLRWPLKDIANAAGVTLALARELADKGVLKGADQGAAEYVYRPRHGGKVGAPVVLVQPGAGPCWWCSRFVRDEWVRQRRGSATRFDSDNQPPKPPPKAAPNGPPIPPFGDWSGDGPPSASAVVNTEDFNGRIARAHADSDELPSTKAGDVGRAFKRASVDPTTLNLSDPRLLELIRQGATPDEFEGLAKEAVRKGIDNPFPWVLVTLQKRRQEAAGIALAPPPADPMAWRRDPNAVMAKGAELGVKFRPGELINAYTDRVVQAFYARRSTEGEAA
ncbi:MAG: hypothetical protein HY855_25085 [Burkholderiales bacterium]|nr:hypothetical protein [Burkholderiales bacterium]